MCVGHQARLKSNLLPKVGPHIMFVKWFLGLQCISVSRDPLFARPQNIALTTLPTKDASNPSWRYIWRIPHLSLFSHWWDPKLHILFILFYTSTPLEKFLLIISSIGRFHPDITYLFGRERLPSSFHLLSFIQLLSPTFAFLFHIPSPSPILLHIAAPHLSCHVFH